jgi:hypothetical protein
MHFWVGSFCYVRDQGKPVFPQGVISISDVITLTADLGNKIPDKSWMLYLLEIFNLQNIAVELNLICSFNDNGKFHAIFKGVNQYEFKEIMPIVGHSYLRQIILNKKNKSIIYILKDQTLNKSEKFILSLNVQQFAFETLNHFTGVEWWNKVDNFPYQIRFQVEISQLLYGLSDNILDSESVSYLPYNQLIPNKEGACKQYPISFNNLKIKNDCVYYSIDSGLCETGLRYNG